MDRHTRSFGLGDRVSLGNLDVADLSIEGRSQLRDAMAVLSHRGAYTIENDHGRLKSLVRTGTHAIDRFHGLLCSAQREVARLGDDERPRCSVECIPAHLAEGRRTVDDHEVVSMTDSAEDRA